MSTIFEDLANRDYVPVTDEALAIQPLASPTLNVAGCDCDGDCGQGDCDCVGGGGDGDDPD